jgi:hypothetical protein
MEICRPDNTQLIMVPFVEAMAHEDKGESKPIFATAVDKVCRQQTGGARSWQVHMCCQTAHERFIVMFMSTPLICMIPY